MGNKIKLIALDIDGTIFHIGGQISPRVKQAITKAQQKGVVVALCTGRWYSLMDNFCQELHMSDDTLHITSNGAVILNSKGKVFDRVPMSQKALHSIINTLSEKHISFGLCDEHDFYTYKHTYDRCLDYQKPIFVESPEDFKKMNYVSKLYIKADEHLAYVKSLLDQMPFDYAFVSDNYVSEFDIWPKETNKGLALTKLANHYGFTMNNVMFVGDGGNDTAALAMAGQGVAMGQASETTKSFADVIAPTFAEDGAAWAIEQFVLKN